MKINNQILKSIYFLFFVFCFLFCISSVFAFQSTSPSFEIHGSAIQSISGEGTSTTFRLRNAGGQIATGISTNIGKVYSGVLYWLHAFFTPRYEQIHYRWRNDDGSESAATWAASENTQLENLNKNTIRRLRFQISNEGWTRGAAPSFRIEYAQTLDCPTGSYQAVPTDASLHWQIVDSGHLTDGSPTTNVSGGLTDENAFFVAGQVKDTGNQTTAITVTSENFTEIEYSIQATNNAIDGAAYCFRLTNAGSITNFIYTRYARVTLAAVGHSVSGTVCTIGNCTANIGSGVGMVLRQNGINTFTTNTTTGGAYTFSGISMAVNDVLTIYVGGAAATDDNPTHNAVTVTKISAAGNLTGINLITSRVIVRHEGTITELTNNDMNFWDSANDADVRFLASAISLVVENTEEFHILTGKTFRPGGALTTSSTGTASGVGADIHINTGATLNMQSNALSVGGDYNNSGVFSKTAGQTTIFTATAAGFSIAPGTGNFENITFNGTGGGWSFSTAVTIDTDLTMTAGTLSGTNNIAVSGGDATGSGIINLTGGTFTIDGAGNFGGAATWTFHNLTIGGNATVETTTAAGTGGITVTNILTIGANQTLNAGSKIWTLSAGGTPFVISGTFTASTSTFRYTGSVAANITATTYNNLELLPSANTLTFTLAGGTINTNGYLTAGNGINTGINVTAAANPTILNVSGGFTISANTTFTAHVSNSFTVGGNWSNSGIFSANGGTLTLNGSGLQSLSGVMTGGSSFNNLIIANTSGSYIGGCAGITPSVDFNAAASATTYTITTGSVEVEYQSGTNYTFTNINWQGSAGNLIVFRNSEDANHWNLIVSGSQTVLHVDVRRSNASMGIAINATGAGNVNCGENINWNFYQPSISFSLSANSLNLGNINVSVVASNSHTVTVSTNAPGGYIIYVSENQNFCQAINVCIADVITSPITAGTEAYGLNTGFGDFVSDSAITGAMKIVRSRNTAIPGGETTTCIYRAAVSHLTRQGLYTHTVTYIATGRF